MSEGPIHSTGRGGKSSCLADRSDAKDEGLMSLQVPAT